MRARAWVVGLCIVAGCESIPSDELRAQVGVSISATSLYVDLRFTPSYELHSDEHLVVTVGDIGVELTHVDNGYEQYYAARLSSDDGDVVPDVDELTLTFDRPAVEQPTTLVATAPVRFTLTAPKTVPAADPLVVTWSPTADDTMHWAAADGVGVGFAEGPIRGDPGSLTFPPGVLAPLDPTFDSIVELRMLRIRSQTPESAFAYANVVVRRSVSTFIGITR
jgi:hypothetical protein